MKQLCSYKAREVYVIYTVDKTSVYIEQVLETVTCYISLIV